MECGVEIIESVYADVTSSASWSVASRSASLFADVVFTGDTTISFQSVMKRGAVATTDQGQADGSADAASVRESGLSVEAGVTGPVYVESWGSVVVKCLCYLVARLE